MFLSLKDGFKNLLRGQIFSNMATSRKKAVSALIKEPTLIDELNQAIELSKESIGKIGYLTKSLKNL